MREIAIKVRAGRLKLADPLHAWMPGRLQREGFLMLSVAVEHAVAVALLPITIRIHSTACSLHRLVSRD